MKNNLKIFVIVFTLSLTSCKKNIEISPKNKTQNSTDFVEDNLKININSYKFFSFVNESNNIIAENSTDKEFNLLIILSDNKEDIYEKIMTEDYSPRDVIKKYKNLKIKQLSFKFFTKLSNVEGGIVVTPKYPCEVILSDINLQTMNRMDFENKYVKSKKELIELINSLKNISEEKIQSNVVETEFKIPEGYYELESKEINLKETKFKIITLEKTDNKAKEHFANQVIILKNINGSYFKYLQNYNVIFEYDDNCPSEGYEGIVIKDNYFTIQQMFCSDFKFVHSFTTFKIDELTNEIFLYKHGQKYTDRSNPDRAIPDDIWTEKDFGKVTFEEFNERFMINLIQNRPKK